MKIARKLEGDFKRWLRGRAGVWSTSVEYGLGGDAGFPDMCWPIRGLLFPVELKRAVLREEKGRLVLKSDEIRPDQLGWHRNARKAGVKTIFLFGVEDGADWRMFWAVEVEHWKEGFGVGFDCWEISLSGFIGLLEELANEN